MKAITLTQPWASLVAIGVKKIETRSWRTHHRGPLAIHAGQGLGVHGKESTLWLHCLSDPFRVPLLEAGYGNPGRLPRGEIVAVAWLAECAPITDDGVRTMFGLVYPETPEHDFGDYTPGRWAWFLADVQRLATPVACRGGLGLWTVPLEVEARVVAEALR